MPSRGTRLGLALMLLAGLGGCTQAPEYDLVLPGGRVMDPASGLDSVRNVGITGGKIAAISAEPLRGEQSCTWRARWWHRGSSTSTPTVRPPATWRSGAGRGDHRARARGRGLSGRHHGTRARAGKAPINFGATVSHIAARFWVFNGVKVGHWPTNPGSGQEAGPMPAAANAAGQRRPGRGARRGHPRGPRRRRPGGRFRDQLHPGRRAVRNQACSRVAAERQAPVFVHTRAFGIGADPGGDRRGARHRGFAPRGPRRKQRRRRSPRGLALIDSVRAAGQDVTTEVYPYTAASTLIESAIFNPGLAAEPQDRLRRSRLGEDR